MTYDLITPTSDWSVVICVSEEVMLAEEDKNAEEKSMDGAWYKRKHNNSGDDSSAAYLVLMSLEIGMTTGSRSKPMDIDKK